MGFCPCTCLSGAPIYNPNNKSINLVKFQFLHAVHRLIMHVWRTYFCNLATQLFTVGLSRYLKNDASCQSGNPIYIENLEASGTHCPNMILDQIQIWQTFDKSQPFLMI